MAAIEVKMEFVLHLTSREINLFGKVLAGVELTEDELEEGRLMNLHLMKQKANHIANMMKSAEHAVVGAERLLNKEEEE